MALDFEQVNEWLEESEAPDFVVDAFKSSKLRAVIAEKDSEIARLKPFEAKVQKLEKAPAIKQAFSQVGVDVDSLPKYAKAIVENFDGDLADSEALSSFVAEWELPTSEVTETQTQAPAAAAVVAHAQAPRVTGGKKTLDDEIAEAEALMFDTSQPIELRQQAAAIARSLKSQRIRPDGLSATPA